MLHVLGTLESRAVMLSAELRELEVDIANNECMGRKYGANFFSEGAAQLARTRVRSHAGLRARYT